MKKCNRCNQYQPSVNYSRSARAADGMHSRCKSCDQLHHAAANPKHNPKGNAVSKLAYRLAGGSPQFYSLSKSARSEIRQAATALYYTRKEVDFTYRQIDEDFATNHKRGFVYAITNPAFPGWVKVGMTTDPLRRLDGYQTGDPSRAYKLEAAKQVEGRRQAELELHQELEAFGRRANEWFEVPVEFVVSRLQ